MAEAATAIRARIGWSVGWNVSEPKLDGTLPRHPAELWVGTYGGTGARWHAG